MLAAGRGALPHRGDEFRLAPAADAVLRVGRNIGDVEKVPNGDGSAMPPPSRVGSILSGQRSARRGRPSSRRSETPSCRWRDWACRAANRPPRRSPGWSRSRSRRPRQQSKHRRQSRDAAADVGLFAAARPYPGSVLRFGQFMRSGNRRKRGAPASPQGRARVHPADLSDANGRPCGRPAAWKRH